MQTVKPPRPLSRKFVARAAGLERAPVYRPHKLASFPPFPWRGFALCAVIVAIAAALYLLSK